MRAKHKNEHCFIANSTFSFKPRKRKLQITLPRLIIKNNTKIQGEGLCAVKDPLAPPPPPRSLLATDRSKAVVFGVVPTKCFWGRCFVSYLYSFVVNLYVNGSGSITSVGGRES